MKRNFWLVAVGVLLLPNARGADAPVAPVAVAATAPTTGVVPIIDRVQKTIYGKTADGADIEAYTLTNKKGAEVKILTFGATIAELSMPDRDGKFANVVLAANAPENFLRFNQPASVMGRVANRIAGAKFTLEGKDYTLFANDGPNTLHGGKVGFNKVNWQAEIPTLAKDAGQAVKLTYVSKDGEEGFPGTLTTTLTYTLTEENVLRLEYSATTDQATPINFTNHAYFNFAGGAGDSKSYELMINADKYTVADDKLIPTGEIAPVKDTPFDFTQPTALGARADKLGTVQHYDASYVLNREKVADHVLAFAARVKEPTTGRVVEVWTTEPGLQIYTSQLGTRTGRGTGFVTLETQHFPDSIHHANFPNTVLKPGEKFTSETEYRFSAK